jgi:hypothetical protein
LTADIGGWRGGGPNLAVRCGEARRWGCRRSCGCGWRDEVARVPPAAGGGGACECGRWWLVGEAEEEDDWRGRLSSQVDA